VATAIVGLEKRGKRVDIERWFAIESPKEMSEAFAQISAIYYIAQVGAAGDAAGRAIEARLESICDPAEWFASCMCLESVSMQARRAVRWAAES
jgi:hypothetical protein